MSKQQEPDQTQPTAIHDAGGTQQSPYIEVRPLGLDEVLAVSGGHTITNDPE